MHQMLAVPMARDACTWWPFMQGLGCCRREGLGMKWWLVHDGCLAGDMWGTCQGAYWEL